jgi:hypothetical protein
VTTDPDERQAALETGTLDPDELDAADDSLVWDEGVDDE